MTTLGADRRRVPTGSLPSSGHLGSGPVQSDGSRVNDRMNETEVRDELHGALAVEGPLIPASGRPGAERFGADAVPLRPTAERDAEVEREERRRLVAAGSRRRSRPRRGRRLALGVALLGLVVLAVAQISKGGDDSASGHVDRTAAVSGSRNPSPRPPFAGPYAGEHRAARSRRAERHRSGARPEHRQSRPPNRRGQVHHRVQTGTSETIAAEPAPEADVPAVPEPEPEPRTTLAPEPESTPSTPAPEPTSSPQGKTTEQSQVEAQFGFEK